MLTCDVVLLECVLSSLLSVPFLACRTDDANTLLGHGFSIQLKREDFQKMHKQHTNVSVPAYALDPVVR